MTKEGVWPNKRHSLFAMQGDASNFLTQCNVNHINCFNSNWLGDQFQRAGVQLTTSICQDVENLPNDGLFMPIAYLYRHALELKLKSLLYKIGECDIAEYDPLLLKKHNLMKIWVPIKPALIKHWPNANNKTLSKKDKKPLNNVEALIKDFHKIDKSGQRLRYTSTINGDDVRNNFPDTIRLDMFAQSVNEVCNFLDACYSYFIELHENINDQSLA